MRSICLLSIAACLSLSLGACSSTDPMSTGDRISKRGSTISNYGDDWSKGQDNVEQGERSVAKSSKTLAAAERDLVRARERVAEAEQKINDANLARISGEQQIKLGAAEMLRAEAAYAATKSGPSAVPPVN